LLEPYLGRHGPAHWTVFGDKTIIGPYQKTLKNCPKFVQYTALDTEKHDKTHIAKLRVFMADFQSVQGPVYGLFGASHRPNHCGKAKKRLAFSGKFLANAELCK